MAISRARTSNEAMGPASLPAPARPSRAAAGGNMTLSELIEQGEPVFEMGDGCDSIVIPGTGTSAGVHCDWSGKTIPAGSAARDAVWAWE